MTLVIYAEQAEKKLVFYYEYGKRLTQAKKEAVALALLQWYKKTYPAEATNPKLPKLSLNTIENLGVKTKIFKRTATGYSIDNASVVRQNLNYINLKTIEK